jgi:hypothetical protein
MIDNQDVARRQPTSLGMKTRLTSHSSMAKKNFGISDKELAELAARDVDCVYCRKPMIYPYSVNDRKNSSTIEHLNFDGPFHRSEGLQTEDIVMCCGSCNSSRGAKTLSDWFESRYCIEKNISADTVAEPVRSYLQRQKAKTTRLM